MEVFFLTDFFPVLVTGIAFLFAGVLEVSEDLREDSTDETEESDWTLMLRRATAA